jgi:myo-inositol-1(or 4)-monophosphatase
MNQETLSELEHRLREAAEDELLSRFKQVDVEIKADGSLQTEADNAMQTRMQKELNALFPEHVMLGEEMDADLQHELLASAKQGLWVLDPLDGTSNFAIGIPYFCVSLALILRGEVQLALVYDPVRQELFEAQAGAGARLNGAPLGRRLPLTPLQHGIGLVDYKRLPAKLARRLVEAAPYSSQRSFGSVALDFCWLAAGRVHVYLHGRHKLWDYAAGLTILHEAGGDSVTLEGVSRPPVDLVPRSTAAALDAGLFREWCAWLGVEPRAG